MKVMYFYCCLPGRFNTALLETDLLHFFKDLYNLPLIKKVKDCYFSSSCLKHFPSLTLLVNDQWASAHQSIKLTQLLFSLESLQWPFPFFCYIYFTYTHVLIIWFRLKNIKSLVNVFEEKRKYNWPIISINYTQSKAFLFMKRKICINFKGFN